MSNVVFPWPPKELSPNSRLHHMALHRVKKAYRNVCWLLAKKAGISAETLGDAKKAEVHLVFYPPDRRGRDMDNMIASMKAGLDGLADALGMDDKHFKVTFDVSDDIGGMVKVSVVPLHVVVPTVAAPRTIVGATVKKGDNYDGAELRPFAGRPGANDSLALPSRMGKTLYYRGGKAVKA